MMRPRLWGPAGVLGLACLVLAVLSCCGEPPPANVTSPSAPGADEKPSAETQVESPRLTLSHEEIEAYAEALVGDDPANRQRAHDALVAAGPPAMPYLAAAVEDPRSSVRFAVVRVLADMGDPQGVAPLAVALSDENWRLREQAAQALGKLRAQAAVLALIRALEDPQPRVAVAAAHALAAIGDRSAAGAILRLFDRPDAREDGLASSIPYSSPANAAHWALAQLVGDGTRSLQPQAVSTPQQLEQARARWQARIDEGRGGRP